MKIQRMELQGITVHDLDAAVEQYSNLFGLTFHIFTPGIDFEFTDHLQGLDSAPALQPTTRLAMDTSGCFELVEMPDVPEGIRNIHFRVDDIDQAVLHATGRGLTVVRDMTAGIVREVVFDSEGLNGMRLCFVEYEGLSFAEALLSSPRPQRP